MAKPESFGKYQIERVLGRGGMGTVYEAVDSVIHRKVALKTMMQHLAGNPDLRARFLREAQAAGGLKHRNIVTVYDLGEDHGQPFIAMEFIEGADLERIIQNRDPIAAEWTVDVLRQICEGLSAAHKAGVIHRDVKPANIRITHDGEVKIMDFGIAHLQAANTMTAGGLVMGTLQYMAPELVDNRKPDRRADIFSVGAIAYELLAHRKPFEADSLSAVMYKITHERADPRRLPKTRFTPGLERIVMKALNRDLEERYQSLDDMRTDLIALTIDSTPKLLADADPARAARLLEKGRALLSAGDAQAALECAKDALALSVGDAAALALARAAEPPETAGDSNPTEKKNVLDDLTAELERARREGQLQKALSLCRRILELAPNDETIRTTAQEIDREIKNREVEQLLAAAVSYAREGDFELSTKIAAKVEKIDASNPKLKELQQYLREEGDRKEAEAMVATAKEHLALGNLEEAVAAAEMALEVHPNHTVAREIRDGASRMLSTRQGAAPAAAAPDAEAAPRPAAAPAPRAEPPVRPAPASPAPPKPEAAPRPEPARPEPPKPAAAPRVEPMPKPAPPPPAPRPAPAPVAAPVAAPAVPAAPPPASAPATPRPAKAPAAASAASVATPPPIAGGTASVAEVPALLESALNHFLMSDNKKARKAVEKVLSLDPGNKKALELMKILGAMP